MERFYILIGILLMLLLEVVRSLNKLYQLRKDEEYTSEFLNKLVTYYNSRGSDDETYIWLTQNDIKMQRLMGDLGVMMYTAPFESHYINNYLVVVNGIDEIRKDLMMGMGEHMNLVRSAILKYSGEINVRHENVIINLKNPLRLLTSAFRNIVLVPFWALNEVGIINSKIMSWLHKSYIVRLLTGIITLLSIFSAIMTVVLGWDEFSKIVYQVIG